MTKYSKLLGELEIISDNGIISTVKVIKTGEIKKLMNANANLQDTPFAKEVKAKSKPMRELTEEENILNFRNSSLLKNILIQSNSNYRSGKAGASSLQK